MPKPTPSRFREVEAARLFTSRGETWKGLAALVWLSAPRVMGASAVALLIALAGNH